MKTVRTCTMRCPRQFRDESNYLFEQLVYDPAMHGIGIM